MMEYRAYSNAKGLPATVAVVSVPAFIDKCVSVLAFAVRALMQEKRHMKVEPGRAGAPPDTGSKGQVGRRGNRGLETFVPAGKLGKWSHRKDRRSANQ